MGTFNADSPTTVRFLFASYVFAMHTNVPRLVRVRAQVQSLSLSLSLSLSFSLSLSSAYAVAMVSVLICLESEQIGLEAEAPELGQVLDDEDLSANGGVGGCLLYTSPSPRDQRGSRMPSSA